MAIGALAGAAIGSAAGHVGRGAALGAGSGLVAGSVIGADNANAAGGSLQARYDTVYAQCMAAKGNRVGGPPPPAPFYPYPPTNYDYYDSTWKQSVGQKTRSDAYRIV